MARESSDIRCAANNENIRNAMTHKERVMAAISHRQPDRVPKGELAIEGDLLRRLIGPERSEQMNGNERELEVWKRLGADLVNVHQFPMTQVGKTDNGQDIFRSVLGDEHIFVDGSSGLHKPALAAMDEVDAYESPDPATCLTDKLDWFVENSELFVFAQVMGPVSSLDWMLGTEDYFVYCLTETEKIKALVEKVIEYEISRAKTFLDHGADAIMVADDIAYNTGLFLPPHSMEEVAWPFYKHMIREIKSHRDVPVFMHTDGNINKVMDRIVDCGFDGLQSLQPSAGMDIAQIKKEYGDSLCLMGNVDLDRLLPFGTPDEVSRQVVWLGETINQDGGFILSTCNILTNIIPVENVYAMYGV
jgi:uroporphyrinogen decarboxylase